MNKQEPFRSIALSTLRTSRPCGHSWETVFAAWICKNQPSQWHLCSQITPSSSEFNLPQPWLSLCSTVNDSEELWLYGAWKSYCRCTADDIIYTSSEVTLKQKLYQTIATMEVQHITVAHFCLPRCHSDSRIDLISMKEPDEEQGPVTYTLMN